MFDPLENARDDAAAARRMPGPDYYEVLGWIHQALRPAVYLEIGVLYGESLRLAQPPTRAIGVDPEPLADHCWRAETEIVALPSRLFFAQALLPRVGLAFLDGSHRFEDTLHDFQQVERHTHADSVILLHDTVPLDARTSSAVRTTGFYTGDVWRMLPWLARFRPHYEVTTVLTPPSGLTLVRTSGPTRVPFLENRREAVHRWLLRQ